MSFWNDHERREQARSRFEARMAIPILIAAVLLTAVTLVLVFVDVSGAARTTLLVVDFAIWGFFAFDYIVRLTLATQKKQFVRDEWLDLVMVVVPVFQPLRLAGAFLRITRLGSALDRTNRSAKNLMGKHKLYLALAWGIGLTLTAAIVTPVVEPDSSKIKSFGDGIWWAVVTTTTVGYGDIVPESTAGRVIALVLMLVGISIIGLLTANIASIFLEPPPTDDEPEMTVEARLAEIDRKIDVLMRRLGEP